MTARIRLPRLNPAMTKRVRGAPAPALTFPSRASRIWRYRADNAGNVSTTPTITFAPSAVNVGANTITIPGLQFLAPQASYTACGGTKMPFATTGTPPAPLQAGTEYLLSRVSGDDYRVFPLYDASMWASVPGMLPEDDPDFAQCYFQNANPIILTSQGTGTHSFVCPTLVRDAADMIGNGFTASVQAGAQADWNRWIPVAVDGSGKKAFKLEKVVRNPVGNAYCHYGKLMQLTGTTAIYNSYRSKIGGQRIVLQTFVINPTMTDSQGVAKIRPTSVSTSTGIFTAANDAGVHGLTAYDTVSSTNYFYAAKIMAPPGSALPAGFVDGTSYYVKSLSSTTFTLHDNTTDALAGTNPIKPTTAGTAGFIVYQPAVPADIERQRNLCETLYSSNDNGNILSAHAGPEQGVYGTNLQAVDFAISASTGDTGAAGRTISTLIDRMGAAGYAKVWLWFPSGSVGPTCIDTGLPLASGYYWITKKPASANLFRLHRTEASAVAGVGIAGSSTTCIKYSAQGSGKCRIEPGDGRATFVVGCADTANALSTWRMPLNTKGVLTVKVDYNPTSGSFVTVYLYWNGVLVDTIVTAVAKGLTPASVNPGTSGYSLFNSFGVHVPFEGLVYEIIMEVSTSDIAEADIQADHAFLMQDYAIAA